MVNTYFILSVALFMFTAIYWGYKKLPAEKWQFLAVLPKRKTEKGSFEGLNLTYYGFIIANSYTFAVVMFMVLCTAAGVNLISLSIYTAVFLVISLPPAKIIAGIVENKKGTLTVGGAVFFGTLAAPVLMYLFNTAFADYGFKLPVIVILSAISIGYTYGEGFGRLACLSFGCCYGKPLCQCSGHVKKIFSNFNVVYSGKTKKISYASGLEGEKVVPIQIITSLVYGISALSGTWLFLEGHFTAALMETIITTQMWRFMSEFIRDDFRGNLKISAYQIMSLITIAYVGAVVALTGMENVSVDLSKSLTALWTPWVLIFLQFVWMGSFLFTGRSVVTGSEISFHVVENKI